MTSVTDLSRAAAISLGHSNDADYMAKSMSNPDMPSSALKYNLMLNAWVFEQSNGKFGYDNASTQDYLQQASLYGISPPTRDVLQKYWAGRQQFGNSRKTVQRLPKSSRRRSSVKPRKQKSNMFRKKKHVRKALR